MKTQVKMIVILITILEFLLVGCDPTKEEVAIEFKPKFDNMRADLQAIAATLPKKPENKHVTQTLNPTPDYDADDYGNIRNTDIVMYANLLDPELDLSDNNQLDLRLSMYVRKYLHWTGSDTFASDKRASKDWITGFEQALSIQYLGIARVNFYDPPVAINADSFTGGYAEVDGFLVDMQTGDILCSFSITARPNENVSYTYKEGETPAEALERFANSTLYTNARQAFVKSMSEMCGGSFALK